MEGVRLRLLFKDPDILSDLQKTEGFKRIWFLLKPQLHTTINDLSSSLLRIFQLHASCPHGILLSMDGFVLPPFESTYILKDKDVVSVEKKGGHLAVDGNNGQKVILAVEGNDGSNAVENLQIVEKHPEIDGSLLLANEAFGHESSDSEDESSDSEESEDDSEKEEEAEPKEDTSHRENSTISKKRKASETLPCSKKKKQCSDVKEKLDEQTKKQQDLTSKKQKRSDTKNKDMENNRGNAESSKDNPITPSTKNPIKRQEPIFPSMFCRNDEVQKSSVENIETNPNSDATKKKGPSRTARRKKAKRQWLREMAKIQEKNALVESEGLRNWKELQAKAGRGEPSRQPEGRVNDEANGQPKGHRNWKQQKTKAKKEEVTGQPKGLLHWKQFHGEDQNRDTDQEKHAEEKSKSSGKSCQNSDTEDEVVPVEIRPGHIRFEPLGKELVSKQSQVEVESFRWNGMMSKKKGQKWGQEKVSFSQRNDSPGSNKERPEMMNCERQRWGQEKVSVSQKNDSPVSNKERPEVMNRERQRWGREKVSFSQNNDSPEMMNRERQKWGQEKVSFSHNNDSPGSSKGHPEMMNRERQKWGQEKVSFPQNNDSLGSNKEHSEMVNGEKEPHCHESIDFNTLPFLSGVPKEGLVIAYRLLELSSTWTPEVSSYRVGKISWCNSEANRVLLMPVAEFPVIFSEDESSKQPDSSIYNEDGSLEIDFSALLEVRLLKNGTPDSAGVPGRVIEGSAANESTPVIGSSTKKTETPSAGAAEVNNGKKTQSTPSGNGGVNLWEQFSETLKAKKTELSQEGSWDKPSSGKSSWSYRSMRGGALGPTMAILRSQNKI